MDPAPGPSGVSATGASESSGKDRITAIYRRFAGVRLTPTKIPNVLDAFDQAENERSDAEGEDVEEEFEIGGRRPLGDDSTEDETGSQTGEEEEGAPAPPTKTTAAESGTAAEAKPQEGKRQTLSKNPTRGPAKVKPGKEPTGTSAKSPGTQIQQDGEASDPWPADKQTGRQPTPTSQRGRLSARKSPESRNTLEQEKRNRTQRKLDPTLRQNLGSTGGTRHGHPKPPNGNLRGRKPLKNESEKPQGNRK
nr:uncharacterized protein LOC123749827 [Procambarus clarkii]